jgi:hypothetical protein
VIEPKPLRLICLVACLAVATTAWAQQRPGQYVDSTSDARQTDARQTKMEFDRLIQHYPPNLRTVLALDPSLLTDQTYLAPYPELAGFLKTHPEITHSPSYYVGSSRMEATQTVYVQPDTTHQFLNGLAGILIFGVLTSFVVWLIRTVIDYRRWNRLSKIQTEVHTRLLDRFTDNADLLAYIQSQAGKRFLESYPIMLDAGPRTVGAPLGRIMWSAQAGIVVAAAGLAFFFIGTRFPRDTARAFEVLGPLCVAIGIGFVISAAASYLISRKMGLIPPPQSAHTELNRGE